MRTAVTTSILIVAVLTCAQSIHAQMGPLNLDILKIERCEGDNNDIVDLEIINIDDKTKGINGFINLPFDLDDTVSYESIVDKIPYDEGEQEGVLVNVGNYACEDLDKLIGDIWSKAAAAAGMPDGCPKPKGNYKLENHPLDYNDIKLENFLYGRFLMHTKFIRLGQEVACVTVEFTNTPTDNIFINK